MCFLENELWLLREYILKTYQCDGSNLLGAALVAAFSPLGNNPNCLEIKSIHFTLLSKSFSDGTTAFTI